MGNGDIVPERGGDGKSFSERWFIPLSITLLALMSFGLGRISANTRPEPVTIQEALEKPELSQKSVGNSQAALLGNFVASKNGKKYYPLSCGGANRIKEENKIYFATIEEAERAGYGKALNCSF